MVYIRIMVSYPFFLMFVATDLALHRVRRDLNLVNLEKGVPQLRLLELVPQERIRVAQALRDLAARDELRVGHGVQCRGLKRGQGGDEQGQLLRRVLRLRHALQEVRAYGIWGSRGRCTGPPGP